MRNIDADNITQAVIARHAAAADPRLREVMTSLVQHVHAFARDVKLTESEWTEGVRFLDECARVGAPGRRELALLSDMLGLSMLVTALNQRKPKGCTEATLPAPGFVAGVARPSGDEPPAACYVRGHVRALDGTPIAGAEVRAGPTGAEGGPQRRLTGSDGSFQFKTAVAAPRAIAHDGPVGRLLHALGRHPWRPAHLDFMISAPGYERLATQVFRKDDPYLDADAVFGVRRSLVADWVRHAPGRTPDGGTSVVPFHTLDFDFVLNPA